MPWYLMEAINHSIAILSWFEHNKEEDIPNENLWDDSEALEKHWKIVRERQEFSNRPGEGSAEDFNDQAQNELANTFKG